MSVIGEVTVCAAPSCKETFQKKTPNHLYHSKQCKREVERLKERQDLLVDISNAIAKQQASPPKEESALPSPEVTIDFLRKEVQRLGREVEKYKSLQHERNFAMHTALTEGLKQFRLEPVKRPHVDQSAFNSELVAVVGFSDVQLSKTTPSYDTNVAEARMYEYIEKCIQIVQIHREGRPISTCHVWCLGDIIEGAGIFPGQSYLVDAGFYRQVTIHGPRIFANCLRRLLEVFDYVEVHCVIGNHGRLGSRHRDEFDPETNGDRMLYRILDHIFANEPRINFVIPDGPGERNWYDVAEIGNYRTLLCHGDQFQSINSLYTVGRKVMSWKEAIPEDWDDIAIGHFHQSMRFTFGKTTMRVFPSSESDNTYAMERLASTGTAMQHLMFVDPSRGVVDAEYDVVLT